MQSVEPVEIHQIQENKLPLDLKDPPPIKLHDVEWRVINTDTTYYCLNTDSYQKLSLNLMILQKYMIEQKAIINAYRSYYEKKDVDFKKKVTNDKEG